MQKPCVEAQLEESQEMCRRLERELHSAIKLIEKQEVEIGINARIIQTLSDQLLEKDC